MKRRNTRKLNRVWKSPTKWAMFGLVMGVVLATVGSVGALNGWFGGSIPSDTTTRGLVGYWAMDEGSGSIAYDSSGYANNATTTNGPTWTKGKVGGAMEFDGNNDYLDVRDSDSLDIASAITLEAWVYDPPPVTDPTKKVKDEHTKALLRDQGINPDYVELLKDYGKRSEGKSPYTRTYKDNMTGKYIMEVQGLPMVDADGIPIDPQWEQAGQNYKEKSNLFNITAKKNGETNIKVKNDQPDGRKQNDQLTFQPQLFLNGAEQTAGDPVLLAIDPVNPNYQNNVLEWDYGIAKRRLRLIEGKVLGSWVFAQNPNGEVRIVYNQVGDYRLKLGQYANGTDEEVVSVQDFQSPRGGYPFSVEDSATFNPDADPETTSVDGYVGRHNIADLTNNWAQIVAGAGTASRTTVGGEWSPYFRARDSSGYWMELDRTIALFDTSSLPDGATIDSAILSFYGITKLDSYSNTPATAVYASTPASNTELVAADYGQTGSTAFSNSITYAAFSTTGYNDYTLNASGLAAIDKAGVSKFSLKFLLDVSGTPTWGSGNLETYTRVYMAEQGAGYKPKLVVTYTTSPALVGKGRDAYSLEIDSSLNVVGYINGQGVTTTVSKAWHHIAFTYDGSDMKIYQDGVLKDRAAATGAISTNNSNLKIGDTVPGKLDEVRIYNRALSAAEVRYHYNRGAPVAHWKFDEGEGRTAYDSTDNNNDGTLVLAGSATSSAWVAGKYGSALSFDGTDDYVDIGNTSQSTVKTVSFWLKADDVTSRKIIDIDGTDQIEIDSSSQVTATSFPGTVTYYLNGIAGSRTLTANTWYHVVITDTSGVNASNMDIGRVSTGYFSGLLDDVRIYNYARTPEEIRLDYNAGFAALFGPKSDCNSDPGSCMTQGLVGYWNMEEGSGMTVYDDSGNNKNASLTSCASGHTDNGDGTCTATFNPDADPETTSVDGYAENYGSADTWTNKRNGAGLSARSNATQDYLTFIYSSSVSPNYGGLARGFFLFDTSSLPDAADIASATLSIYGYSKTNTWSALNPALNIYSSNPASSTNLVAADFTTLETTAFSTAITYANFSVTGYNDFVLNASGLAAISKTGVSKFGTRESNYDAPNVAPTWEASKDFDMLGYMAEKGAGYKPKLVVTYNGPPAWTVGKQGSSLRFSGKFSYLSVGDVYNGVKSVEFWLKTSSSTQQILDLNGSAYVELSSNVITATGWTSPTIYVNGVKTSTITAGAWQHVVITTETGINASAVNLGKVSSYFNGTLDEVRFYSRPLSTSEVRYHYNRGAPQAHWKFDEGEGRTAYDSTDNNNDGTLVLVGSATSSAWVSGKYGGALNFDGADDYVAISDNANLSALKVLTIEAWMKSTDTTGNGVLVSKYSLSNREWYFGTKPGGDTYELYLYDESANAYIGRRKIGSTGLWDGKWHHLVGVWDGGTTPDSIKLYKDGVRIDDISDSSGTFVAVEDLGANVNIGRLSAADGWYFESTIDDVRIYNYARTPEEIRLDYNAGFAALFGPQTGCDQDPGSCMTNGLVGYWNMEEGSGAQVYDQSDYANHGTTSGGPQWTKGKVGGALQFDGVNDYVSLPDIGIAETNSFTVSAWVKISSLSGEDIFYGERNTAPGDAVLELEVYLNKFRAYLRDDSLTAIDISSTSNVVDGNWHYLVWVTAAANNHKLYLDGVNEASSIILVGTRTFNTATIGAEQSSVGSFANFFNGLIDEVRVYNRALSAAEIRYHYNRGGPVAQWKFDEGEGRTAYDSTDNNNDGTLVLVGSATSSAWVAGKYGGSLSFDGVDDYVDAGNVSANARTVSFWLKRGDTSNKDVIDLGTPEIKVASNAITSTGLTSPTYYVDGVQGSTLNTNQWQHITITDTADINASNVDIGKASSNYFLGLIDDVRIYNYARSPEQIRLDYNMGLSTHFK